VTEPIRARLQADLRTAMRARSRVEVATIRSLLGHLANAEAVHAVAVGADPMGAEGVGAAEVARRELTEADDRAVLEAERAELTATATDVRARGAEDAADELDEQAAIVARYL
jgi:uncharacterized protein YqeY